MVDEGMVTGGRWNDTEEGKLKYFEENVFNCHYV